MAKDAYSYLFAKDIYYKFTGRYPRAAELTLKIWGVPSKYVINLIINKKFTSWYRFKAIVKWIEKECSFLDYNKRGFKSHIRAWKAKIDLKYKKG